MEPAENIAAAFSEMDERAVRWLAAQLNWRPSGLKATLNNMVARIISAKFFNDEPDRREVAAMGLGQLGPRAVSAVPSLEAVFQHAAEPRAWSARAAALGALIRIRREPLEPYLEKLRDPSASDWQMYATAMWHLGTNGAPAVPHLVRALEQPAHEGIIQTTVNTLAAIHSQPELTVPALTRQLDHSNQLVRGNAIRGLALFGTAAKPAWPGLTSRLQDSAVMVRVAATNALRQVDAAAARQLGVN
jgi:HEAT repeat protein